MSKKTEPFVIPKLLLDQINEVSNGGFILITIDHEGNPQPYLHFDNGVNAIGLITFAKSWTNALADSNEAQIYNSSVPTEDGEDEQDA
ncbi:MAG: hypothetical protein AABY22_22780 [Nanoarchaeota archaeon]